jgi:hypothetical protein
VGRPRELRLPVSISLLIALADLQGNGHSLHVKLEVFSVLGENEDTVNQRLRVLPKWPHLILQQAYQGH